MSQTSSSDPPNGGSSNTTITVGDLTDVERGDVITIDDTDYPVYRMNSGLRALFVPDHPSVVTPDGEVRDLAYGPLEEDDSSPIGLCFVEDANEATTASDCLTVGLDGVSIREGDMMAIYDRLPTSSSRDCPRCGTGVSCYQFGDVDWRHTREARRCTECETHFLIDRVIPESTAEITTRSHDGTWGETVELAGIYRQVVTSRFKMDPRQRAREGFYSAEEVAQFISARMADDGGQVGYCTAREYPPDRQTVTWYDQRIDQKLEVTFESVWRRD